MTEKDLLIKFMGATIEKVNRCLYNIHAIQQIMISKGIVTLNDMKAQINESEKLPELKKGREILESMIQEFNTKGDNNVHT
jgi:hypothetical protein